MVDREELLEQRVASLEVKVAEGFARVDTDVRELRGEVRGLDEKLTGKIEALGTELRGKIDAQGEELRGDLNMLKYGLLSAIVLILGSLFQPLIF